MAERIVEVKFTNGTVAYVQGEMMHDPSDNTLTVHTKKGTYSWVNLNNVSFFNAIPPEAMADDDE